MVNKLSDNRKLKGNKKRVDNKGIVTAFVLKLKPNSCELDKGNYRLKRVLKNLKDQSYKNIKIKTISLEKNLASALNKAIKQTSTEYILFINFTDTIISTAVEQMVQIASKRFSSDVVMPRLAVGNEYNINDDFFVQLPFPKFYNNNFITKNDLLLDYIIPNLSVIPCLFRTKSVKSFDANFAELSFYKKIIDLSNKAPIELAGDSTICTVRKLLDNSHLPIPAKISKIGELKNVFALFRDFLSSLKRFLVKNKVGQAGSKQEIKLYEAAKNKNYTVNNFGDILTSKLIEKYFHKLVKHAPPLYSELAGAGSMLERLICQKQTNKPFVWGSGFILDDISEIDYNSAKFALLRGKLTLSRIKNIPREKNGKKREIPLGDPGLIVDKLVPKINYKDIGSDKKSKKIGIVPHASEINLPVIKLLEKNEDIEIINPVGEVEEVVKKISQCKFILSSSLHGLITADSYQIPNLHLLISDRLHGGIYKFQDYYSVFSNKRYFQVKLLDIFDKTSDEIIKIIKFHYKKPANLAELKLNIIQSFPY
ncbi:MAG: polysaccharide pyruvyl transferase family protein [Bifidobacteriaceae bacterium]|jgi:hypothetical protein|nr:polysaccharide pyruvyl transferase family protein [Bifidobacteriaceae bacterium]